MEPRLLFNFSASPIGGGLARLRSLLSWFEAHANATFLVHPKVLSRIEDLEGGKPAIIPIRAPLFRRVFSEAFYLKDAVKHFKPDFYFSYGIPLAEIDVPSKWLHISNALSLSSEGVTLSPAMRLKSAVLRAKMIHSLRFADVVSGESNFTLSLLPPRADKGASFEAKILPNGLDVPERGQHFLTSSGEPFALIVGTYPYKRLDVGYDVFLDYARQFGLSDLKLKVVGDTRFIPNRVRKASNVELMGAIGHEVVLQLLEKCRLYISASEIENSSNALLEALILAPKCIISNIPSHTELLNRFGVSCRSYPFGRRSRYPLELLYLDHPSDNIAPATWTEVNGKFESEIRSLVLSR